jgi:hypothetical protein
MPHRSRLALFAFTGLLVTSCGGGGGGGGGHVVAGTVRSPGGQSIGFRAATVPPHVAPRPTRGGREPIELPGTAPVPDGTPVDLVHLDRFAGPNTLIASTTTSGGRYSFDLDALGFGAAQAPVSLAVVAGTGASALRSIVDTTDHDIDADPVSEALVQLVLPMLPIGDWFALTTQEETDLIAAFELLVATGGVAAQPDLAATIAELVQTGEDSPEFMTYLSAAAGAAGTTIEGPGDIGDFFPTSVGDVWGFDGELVEDGGDPVAYRKARHVTGEDGNGVLTLLDTETLDGGTEDGAFVEETSTAFRLVATDDAGDPLENALPFDLARFPLRAGESWEQYDLRGLSLGVDLDGDQQDEVVDLRSQTTCIGFEDVVVPAGTFEGCARFDTTAVTVVHFTSGPSARNTVTSSDWFAPGRGPVRAEERSIVSGAGLFQDTTTEEVLASYQVGTTGHGILPSDEIASDVAPASSDQEVPGRGALAFDGTNYLLVSCREGNVAHLVGYRLTATGVVLGEVEIYPLGLTCSAARPTAVFDGTNFLVAFQTAGQVIAMRVSPDGDVLDPLGIPVSTTGASNFQPAAAFDGENALVVWRKFDNLLSGEIWGAFVTPGGSNLGEFVVRSAGGDQVEPTVVFGAENYLVAWSDDAGSPREIRAARVTPDATVLDAASFDLGPTTVAEERPCASFDGTRYLVAWTTQNGQLSELRAARVELDGTVTDAPPLTIASGGVPIVAPAASFDGTNHVLAWTLDATTAPFGIHAVRVAPDGTLLDGTLLSGGLTVAEPPLGARLVYPVLGRGATNALLAWIVNDEIELHTKDLAAALIYPF